MSKKGKLTVVGCGITVDRQLTNEARDIIVDADKIFYVLHNEVAEDWIESLNPHSESLFELYDKDKVRWKTYNQMTEKVMKSVRNSKDVCLVLYGHPAVFVNPSMHAVKKAKEEGYEAKITPGISAADCLYADLLFDPAEKGCQTYEATDFIIRPRKFDPRVPLILWQIGVIGQLKAPESKPSIKGLKILVNKLNQYYTPDHIVYVYEAAWHPIYEPTILEMPMKELVKGEFGTLSTMLIPQTEDTPIDPKMAKKLGVDEYLAR